jgi:hypothetical protein
LKNIFFSSSQRLNKIKKPKEEEPNFINMANLKQSTNKFAVKEEVKEEDKINYRDQVQLKSAKEHKDEE